jgi:hypothetical protein
MYSRFLAETGREHASALCAIASEAWTALAGALYTASESDDPAPGLWADVDRCAASVLDAEERLWASLA